MSTPPPLPLLQRREIEAGVLGPMLRAFIDRFGRGPVLETARGVIESLANEAGVGLCRRFGDDSLTTFAQALDLWKEGGALEIETLEQSETRLDFNVVRCRYAEMYRELGLADLGFTLSCSRDSALIQGFNPEIELTRTQTIMEGATYCDFRFRRPDATGRGEPGEPG